MAPTFTTDEQRLKKIKDFDQTKAGVKGLSDSGVTVIPDIFIHSENLSGIHKNSTSKSTLSIPVIDLSDLNSDDHKPKIVEQIRQAANTWGFFQIINHGLPVAVLEETLMAVKSFHEQPSEVKSKYYVREEGRGVMYASNNDLYRSKAACWHDSLQVWMAPPAPVEEIPEVCRREVVEWDMHAKKVGECVMELLSLGLGLDAEKFKELSFSGSRSFVGHIYPYCPQPDLTMGIKSHTDPTVLTVLLQNQVKGLQVKHGDEWVDVNPAVPGGLIINIGDLLQIVSNGEYKSVEHRVLANSNRESRISVVMFMNLSKWKESEEGRKYYGPLPELLSPEKPPIYRDFSEIEFTENFYTKGLDSKSLIDKVTIGKKN